MGNPRPDSGSGIFPGGVGVIQKLVNVPSAATAMQAAAAQCRSCPSAGSDGPAGGRMSARVVAATMPRMMETNVHICTFPFPRDRSSGASVSGRKPYFAGLKKALCAPIRNSRNSRSGRTPCTKTRKPAVMITVSATLAQTITRFLLKRSATCPAHEEKVRKGRVSMAPASGTYSLSPPLLPTRRPARKQISSLKRLSLNAPRNCVPRNARNPSERREWPGRPLTRRPARGTPRPESPTSSPCPKPGTRSARRWQAPPGTDSGWTRRRRADSRTAPGRCRWPR